jgi:hypothetical protein
MNLNEAKQILKNAGYIIEDTETNDEEYDALYNEWDKKWGADPAINTLIKKMHKVSNKRMDLKDKIDNAKKFNSNIDKMKKDAVNIFKQAFYEDEVTDNGDGTYTVVPDSNYDITAIYKWDDNDTLSCKFNYSDNVLTFKHLSRHLNYDPKGGPWQEGKWSGDEELENFITDLSFEYQNAMSV